jgi:uncharacterized phiE125 gp8 family phage protein
MSVAIITPPATFPVTLAEAKEHLHVDHTEEDALIQAYIAAATSHAEVFTGRAFMTQTLELVIDSFVNEIEIPRPPLQAVVSIVYDDAAGVSQALSENTDYAVDNVSEPGWVVAINGEWPATIDAINAVRIRYIAGYAAGPTSDIKAAILLTVGSLYAFRETMSVGLITAMMPWSAEQLLRQRRVELALA